MKTETTTNHPRANNYAGMRRYLAIAGSIAAVTLGVIGVKSCSDSEARQIMADFKQTQLNGSYLHRLADIDKNGSISRLEFSILQNQLQLCDAVAAPRFVLPTYAREWLAEEIRDGAYDRLTLADAPYIDFAISQYETQRFARETTKSNRADAPEKQYLLQRQTQKK